MDLKSLLGCCLICAFIRFFMHSLHNQPGKGLGNAGFYCKGYGKVTGPFIKEKPDGSKADVTTANPSADDG